ncbi:PDZ and LIM domain protein 7 [Caloenas nicobarica]|uniref:PDZ and LIM domain protein 7 n=1 Tax=Caloenas nicobarica TaxID=187106 RepID=UPI0032B73DA8
MGDMESYKVMLNGPAPWGFRLQGGKDFSMPLSISRLTPGGKAAQAGVGVGDWVLYIDGENTSSMTHIEAQNRIRACGDRLCLTLSRAQNHLGKPQKHCPQQNSSALRGQLTSESTARAGDETCDVRAPGACLHPPAQWVLSLDKQPPQLLVSPSTPTYDPVKLQLIENAVDWQPRIGRTQSRSFHKLARLTGTDGMEDHEDELVSKPRDARGSVGGTVEQWQPSQPPEPPSTPVCDPGKLRLMEDAVDWQPRTGTSQSRSFHKLARLTGTDGMEDHEDELVSKPRDARGSVGGTVEQWQPSQPPEPPSTPVCDPGKLRLMEDAVDWQPRTGTSQSRSFRKLARLTGTDGMEDHEDELVSKPSSVSCCCFFSLLLLLFLLLCPPFSLCSLPFPRAELLVQLQSLPCAHPVMGTASAQPLLGCGGGYGHWQHLAGDVRRCWAVPGPGARCPVSLAWGYRQPGRAEDARGSVGGTVEQWQPSQPLKPPSTPVCDPGKLRLMEDAVDWQPRTGTSQSRSFRKLARLTGTDGMEDHEDELVSKPRVPAEHLPSVPRRQPSQPPEPPSTPVCDPGKLRLMEDAVDWQPRTGTSQSRSFRKLARLTGTDGMEDHDDVFVKKPSQVSVLDPSPGAAMKTEPGLAPRTPTATPGPASRPPWAVDPSFAERYAPDKTSTVVSKHSQPATPTPMQNRSSIVQAAQQSPEGPGRTPLCYKCNKVIRGRYLVALGHYYHPEEFTCCQCRKVLDEGGFFEEKGSIFCPKCYDTRYAPSCAKCKKKITGEVMHALKMTWHVQCFTCAACKTPIRNRAFYMEEGQPYCERDYEKMFGTKCRGCDFKIDAGDRFLEALGFSWHDTCFVCAICQTNLEGKTFYSKKDKPLCKSHAFSHV